MRLLAFSTALLSAALITVACSGGGDSDDSATDAPRSSETITPEALPTADSAPGDPGAELPVPPTDRGLIAGLDTSISSVPLVDIVFDLFNLTTVTLAEADESTILRIVDSIPPLDSNRALLSPEEQVQVGTVRYITAEEAATVDYIWDTQLVLGYVADDEQAYAYPISILNFHEIINETLAGRPVLVTYCSLCRSGVIYERVVEGEVLNFGNTSALFQSDAVMFDRDPESISYWLQVAGEAVVGVHTGQRLTPLSSITTEWQAWLAQHPDTFVLSDETGFDRPYDTDSFSTFAGAIESADRLPFPVDEETLADGRLSISELALLIEIGSASRAYGLQSFGSLAINDELGGQPLAVFINSPSRYGVAFDPVVEGQQLTFALLGGAFFDVETWSRWDLNGLAVDGPLAGAQLVVLPSRTAFWFSILSAYPAVTVAGVDTSLEAAGS